jgi:hypothetical protein
VTGKNDAQEHHDKSTVGTIAKLIELYKREFGDDWPKYFASTVKCWVPRQS